MPAVQAVVQVQVQARVQAWVQAWVQARVQAWVQVGVLDSVWTARCRGSRAGHVMSWLRHRMWWCRCGGLA